MTALAQGGTGLALVLCFGLLRTRQAGGATLLLLAQSAAVVVTAIALDRPEMGAGPLVLAAAVWAARHRSAALGLLAPPIGGPEFGVLAGAVLAVLCQSQAEVGVPLAIVLLGVLLAATRPHALMQVVGLVVAQNGIALAGCHLEPTLLLPVACLVVPVPLAAVMVGPTRFGWRFPKRRDARWFGWGRFGLSAAIFAATLIIPLDPLAVVFAPLFGFEGLLRAWAERRRIAKAPFGHTAAVIRVACAVLAVAVPDSLVGWMAILGALAATLLPTLERRWPNAVLVFSAQGFALFGLLAVQTGAPLIGYFAILMGYGVVAAFVPDLAAPLVVLVLRLTGAHAWSPAAAWLASLVALLGLLTCCAVLHARGRQHRLALLHLAQAAVALLAIGLDQPDGRYAGIVLLILLTLTRAASRIGSGLAAIAATAGLSGIPPLGVSPAMILVVLAFCGHDPWLLLPLGAALLLLVPASLPVRLSLSRGRTGFLSVAWLPLALAFVVGFFTPDSLAHWLHRLTVGPS